jgi:hypothetical protein
MQEKQIRRRCAEFLAEVVRIWQPWELSQETLDMLEERWLAFWGPRFNDLGKPEV